MPTRERCAQRASSSLGNFHIVTPEKPAAVAKTCVRTRTRSVKCCATHTALPASIAHPCLGGVWSGEDPTLELVQTSRYTKALLCFFLTAVLRQCSYTPCSRVDDPYNVPQCLGSPIITAARSRNLCSRSVAYAVPSRAFGSSAGRQLVLSSLQRCTTLRRRLAGRAGRRGRTREKRDAAPGEGEGLEG